MCEVEGPPPIKADLVNFRLEDFGGHILRMILAIFTSYLSHFIAFYYL